MYASIVYMSLFIALTSCLGIFLPRTVVLTFLLPSGVAAYFGVLSSLLLTNFAVLNYLRRPVYKRIFGVLGVTLLLVAATGLLQPRYFGLMEFNVQPADLLVIVVVGINALIAATELNREGLTLRSVNLVRNERLFSRTHR